ncbi:uncharacterized protein [Vicugna pacos]|uniref:Uncharacterized protein n=1 Tax=Vicugna pacos TaxID=30538 RepID=A0ABM5D2B5_VICPA
MKASGGLGAAGERTEGSAERAEPTSAFRTVSGTGGTPVPARNRGDPGNGRGRCVRAAEERDPKAGARSVPYRALGTSTGPRPPPPPPGPASTSPPYFSSISGIRSRRRCPRRGVSSCLSAAAEERAQARHSPMAAAPSGPLMPGRRCRCPRLRLTSTRASGLGRGQFRRRRVPWSLTRADAARPRHQAQQPSLSRECLTLRMRTTQHWPSLPLP